MAANVEVWMAVDNTYQRALTIPINTCLRFSVFPLTWLCYLGFAICGREGHISDSPDGSEITYRPTGPPDNEPPVIQPGIYYYCIAEDPLWLHADMTDDRASFATAATDRRIHFRRDIINRDGSCVMTGETAENCQACYIIPHSRGDEYIIDLAGDREEAVEPPFEGINDTRNGLLLHISLHRPFGEFRIAFLRTPNVAMDVSDVQHVTQPNGDDIDFLVQKRLTLQHFNNNDRIVAMAAPHNSDVRMSGSAEWPPDLLFDVAYGCAALAWWGDPAFKALIRINNNNGSSGNRGRGNNRGRGRGSRDDGQAQANIQGSRDRDERAVRREKAKNQATNTADTQMADCADVVFALWTRNARKAQRQPEAEVMKADRKVQTWLDSLA